MDGVNQEIEVVTHDFFYQYHSQTAYKSIIITKRVETRQKLIHINIILTFIGTQLI